MKDLNEDEGVEEDLDDDIEDLSESIQKDLWVEKYAPRKYTDLLSEEVNSVYDLTFKS